MDNEDTDEYIVKRVQSGDSEAFGVLIERYETKLHWYGRRFLNRHDDIIDLVQDSFISAYTNIQSFDTKLRFAPWLYRIAHNKFVNELRRRDTFQFVFDADIIFALKSSTETADAEILTLEATEELEATLKHLSPKYREIISLYYFDNFSYEEISDILKIPINTVGVRLTRARQKLKELLTKTNNS